MANLSRYTQTITLYNTTSCDVGGTGVAISLSTAGSSGTGVSTSSPGGYPWASTGLNPGVSLAGFDGVRFTAIPNFFSTGGGANSSGIFTLQAYFALSSTSSSTTWVAIKDAYAMAYTTGGGSQGIAPSTLSNAMTVDVYRPAVFAAGYTAVGAVVQIPTCSGGVTIIADRYATRALPFTASTGINGLQASTTLSKGPTVSVNGTT